jgi:diguanylate cyclase (GGDEF)-like protein
MLKIIEYLERQPKKELLILCFMLIVFVGVCDYLAGPEIGLSIFYLIPISLATWFAGITGGIVTSVGSAVAWFAAKWTGNAESHKPLASFWDTIIRLVFFLVIVFQQNMLKHEHLRARRDPLTGISNRRHFFELAGTEMIRAQRYKRPFTVAYMDLDNFKKVNDLYGHDVGDVLLRLVSKIMRRNIRSTDTVARLGGDEFAVLLPEADAQSARQVTNKLHEQLLAAMQRKNWPVTFSVGVVTFRIPPSTVDDMVKVVDDLMYKAKKGGKNQVRYEVIG